MGECCRQSQTKNAGGADTELRKFVFSGPPCPTCRKPPTTEIPFVRRGVSMADNVSPVSFVLVRIENDNSQQWIPRLLHR
jgi:hypothetical protein